MSGDDLSAALAGIKERAAKCLDGFSSDPTTYIRSAGDVPRLLAAVEAALKAADHFASEADRFGKLSETADEESGAVMAALAAWQAYDRCAKTFRAAITAELAKLDTRDGKGGDDDH